MIRIWLNHWFSTAFNVIKLIKQDDPDFYIIGSNEHLESPIKAVCDEWYQEPVLKGKEYIQLCLDFCKEHHVDIFMPRREMVAVSKYKSLFSEIGVKVMVDDYSFVSMLNQKDEAYCEFSRLGIGNVPEYYMATSRDQFIKAYENLEGRYNKICFKFVHDEGGKSYRLIDNSKKGYASLFKKQTTRISMEAALESLSEKDHFSPIMVMPYLPDEEISVDCLATDQGVIAIPRVKDATRVERVEYRDEILQACGDFFCHFPLICPCNVQFKYLNGTPYLLEVNTRMSGGIQMSCAVSGINIPNIAVNKMLGIRKNREERYPCGNPGSPIIVTRW